MVKTLSRSLWTGLDKLEDIFNSIASLQTPSVILQKDYWLKINKNISLKGLVISSRVILYIITFPTWFFMTLCSTATERFS